jgi:DNA-binding response OmpR family regulator
MAKRILCISYDRALLQTRKMLLEDAGYEVVEAEGFAEAMSVSSAQGPTLDLVILGHSITPEETELLISHIRANTRVPVLALLRGCQSAVPGAARSIVSLDPGELLKVVREMLGP